ncbi:MAG TPA: hypothetical protein VFK09_07530, partial [Gemmatimonadales bacterium]|nr:hypothetical protein [Gemmatimonadales bacterium]
AAVGAPPAAAAQRPGVDIGSVRARTESAQARADTGEKAMAAATRAATAPAAKTAASGAAAKPAGAPAAKLASTAPKPEDVPAADSLSDPAQSNLLRETFSYGGAPRDPFASLIKTANAGPELADLQLVGIYQDMRYSGNSIALLREKTPPNKRHKLRVGDQLGRLRVSAIRPKEVVFTISDFGYERQETLSLRKQEDVTP